MAVVAPPSDLAILCSYEVSGAVTGRLQVAIPYATVEPVKKLLASPPRPGRQRRRALLDRAWPRGLENVSVELRVEMGRTSMTFSKMLDLKVGDLLILDGGECIAAAGVRAGAQEADRLAPRGRRKPGGGVGQGTHRRPGAVSRHASRKRSRKGARNHGRPTMNTQTRRGERRMDLLLDVPLELSVELGRARMTIQDLLASGLGR